MPVAIVTRPEADAGKLKAALAARGFRVMLDPMLRVMFQPGPPLDLKGIQALLFTSANGVRAFCSRSTARDLPAFAVGDATARTAKESGFEKIDSASGDVAALAALVAERLAPGAGALLHPAASVTAGNLQGALGAKGFHVRRAVLYATEPATALSETTISALCDSTPCYVTLFSPRTAESFVTLVGRSRAGDKSRDVIAACLSPAVAERAANFAWTRILVADRPTQDALLRTLESEIGRY